MKIVRKYLIPNEDNDFKPHLLRKTGVAVIAVIAMALFVIGIFQNFLFVRTSFLSAVLPPVLVDLTNTDRQSNQLATLVVNPLLVKAAQEKASDMAAKSYFAHTSPEGRTPWYWFSQAGYKYVSAGENLAINFTESGDVNSAWMNSPGHRANILNGKFTEIGIATAQGFYNGQPTVYVVQMFGKPASVKSSLPVAQKPTQAKTVTKNTGQGTSTASTSPLKIQNSKPVSTIVLGESELEITSSEPVVSGTEMFVAVESTDVSEEVVSDTPSVSVQNATVGDKLATSQKGIFEFLFKILIGLVIIALSMMIGIEWKHQHPKMVLVATLLLVFILILLYCYQNVLFGQPIVV